MIQGWWNVEDPLPTDLRGFLLGAEGGVWIHDDPEYMTPLEPPPGTAGILWVGEYDLLNLALGEEAMWSIRGDFDTRPWAMPLQEREQMGVLLAQRGLTCHVLRGFVFEYAGLPVLRRDLSPVAGGAANSQ